MDGVAAKGVGVFDRLSGEDAVVEADGEFDRGFVADRGIHTDDVGDIFDNDFRLGFGIASVKHNTFDVVSENLKEIGEGFAGDELHLALVIF